MKAAAFILIAVTGLLLVQPGFQHFNATAALPSCIKSEPAEPSCSNNKCEQPSPGDDENDDCGPDRCNPFMGCATGNFYVHNYWTILIEGIFIPKQKITVRNDNRISGSMNECWHPPEII